MIELLRTKLYIPRSRSSMISRPRLVDHLNANLDKDLTLIAAPAGFGKTTLLGEWIPQSLRCVTWLSLDQDDNDPTRFWTYFISSLQQLRPDLGASALALLQSAQAPPITSILTSLINDLAAFPDVFASVIDDYHVIDSQAINEGLTYLIAHQPANMHMILTTRADPPLHLARLRARNLLNEMRANDLRFTSNETALFLSRSTGLNLSPDEIAAMETRTEGWIAGLQIAALSMQDQEDISEFIQAFSGSHRHILGYLAEEVLNQQPKETMNFLLQTSILDRLSGSLCEAVTGIRGGKEILRKIEQANLFIVPLDNEGELYRYHHLFVEVLRARLQQTQFNIKELHYRASMWYEQVGRLPEAVSHALSAEDFDHAARLIEQISSEMWQRGNVTTLQNWLDRLPQGIRRSHPQLCLAQAWAGLAVGQFAVVDTSILEAEEAISSLAETEVKPLRAQLDAIRSTLAGFRQDSAKAIQLAHQSLEYLPAGDHFLRGLLAYNLGLAYLAQGDLPAASQKLRDAANFSLNIGDWSTAGYASAALGAELYSQGQLREAASCFRYVIQAIQKDGRPLPVFAVGGAYVWLGRVLYEWNQLDDSTQYTNLGIELSSQNAGAVFVGSLVLVNVLSARGNLMGAVDALRNAEIAANSGSIPQATLRMVAAVRAQLDLAQKNIADAAQWATIYERNLTFPASGDWPGTHQIRPIFDYECLILIRVRMAQAQTEEGLRLLARLQPIVEAGARKTGVIQIFVLRALAFQTQNQNAEAITSIERALILAEPEGFIRIFVDEGEVMRNLLLDYQLICRMIIRDGHENSDTKRILIYTEKLLAAFARPAIDAAQIPGALAESLSERELEILRLIAVGCTNQEIAEILVVALSTVKSHINNLYGKLGTHRRTQVVARARDLGLLPD